LIAKELRKRALMPVETRDLLYDNSNRNRARGHQKRDAQSN
jgi:hypothetical protein